jgi:hypothetical protein
MKGGREIPRMWADDLCHTALAFPRMTSDFNGPASYAATTPDSDAWDGPKPFFLTTHNEIETYKNNF